MQLNSTGLSMFFGLTRTYKVVSNGLIQNGRGTVAVRSQFADKHDCIAICTIPCESDSKLYHSAREAKTLFENILRAMGKLPQRRIKVCV